MKGDAIARSDAARCQSARKSFGFGSKPLVRPYFLVKDERRALWPSLRLVRQSIRWSYFHWLVSLADTLHPLDA
jgi:hypothetical protein